MVSIPGLQLVIPGGDWTFAPEVPRDEEKIWRYVDLAKLASLLQSSALCLPRADCLGDPLEGGWSNAAIDAFKTYASEDYLDKALSIHRTLRRRSWVSCWHASEDESEALWRLYSKDSQGISIQTTVGRLTEIVPVTSPNRVTEDNDMDIRYVELSAVSRVHYLNYSTHGPHLNNTIGPLICKRAAFAHEKEVRAIVQSLPLRKGVATHAPDGATVLLKELDLGRFVQKIFVDPLAPDWFLNVVEKLVAQYKVDVPVVRSTLCSTPVL